MQENKTIKLNEQDIKHLIKDVISKKLNEQKNIKTKSRKYISENTNITNQTIVSVDIQPEYKNWISFDLYKWVQFIKNAYNNNNKLVFLYNGADTLGMISKEEYITWLLELGIEEEVVDNITFYDKGYAFFRYCMDEHINEDAIVDLIKFMIKNNINDSRKITKTFWNKFIKQQKIVDDYSATEIRDLLENASDMINIPDLMDFMSNFNNINLTGGGINECLKEVEIALKALNKNYNIIQEFTY